MYSIGKNSHHQSCTFNPGSNLSSEQQKIQAKNLKKQMAGEVESFLLEKFSEQLKGTPETVTITLDLKKGLNLDTDIIKRSLFKKVALSVGEDFYEKEKNGLPPAICWHPLFENNKNFLYKKFLGAYKTIQETDELNQKHHNIKGFF